MKLSATFVKEGDNGFTGWINEFTGVTAYGQTIDIATEELLRVLKLKFEAERKRAVEETSQKTGLIHKELTVSF